ncbi:transferase family protein [Xylariaceae sp. FL0662B]|nr:transferase family protein [Xylariaceae sp. FL0662B]
MAKPQCRVRSIRRVFPTTASKQPKSTRLSIVDASVARFAPCGAIWLYNSSETINGHDPTLLKRLEKALKETLNDYPHYAGQLQWATKELVEGDANPRYVGRPVAVYGTAEDPGLELVIAEDSRELSAVVPSRDERSTTKKLWNATDFPQNDLLPKTKLAFTNLADFKGLPGVAVQLTCFKCGGFAVSMLLTHCLSDALCLLQFIHAWAARSSVLFDASSAALGSGSDTIPRPLFDPSQLDRHARLTSGKLEPDADMVRKARALPMHRFDWWATDAPGYPAWADASSNATKRPADELARLQLSPSTIPPWPTWDTAAPVEHVQIRFGASEVARMKKAAEETLPDSLTGQPVSRLDAVLAHTWILINRARQLAQTQGEVYMDMALGLRGRVEPPLPDTFVGSPILLAYVAKTGAEACAATIGAVAGTIRQVMARFTPDAVAAYLHDAACEVSPQRLWQAFLGRRHTLVTSWVRARAYEVGFCGGRGAAARYVQGVMPRVDGLVQVMDVEGGFDVSLCLEREAMRRLVRDPMLRMYEG